MWKLKVETVRVLRKWRVGSGRRAVHWVRATTANTMGAENSRAGALPIRRDRALRWRKWRHAGGQNSFFFNALSGIAILRPIQPTAARNRRSERGSSDPACRLEVAGAIFIILPGQGKIERSGNATRRAAAHPRRQRRHRRAARHGTARRRARAALPRSPLGREYSTSAGSTLPRRHGWRALREPGGGGGRVSAVPRATFGAASFCFHNIVYRCPPPPANMFPF
jgi:hypothetical protein